jgi:hypothetical protein
VFFLNGKGRAIKLVLSSRSLRYARVVFAMEGKGSAVPERDRSQFETNFFFNKSCKNGVSNEFIFNE